MSTLPKVMQEIGLLLLVDGMSNPENAESYVLEVRFSGFLDLGCAKATSGSVS